MIYLCFVRASMRALCLYIVHIMLAIVICNLCGFKYRNSLE